MKTMNEYGYDEEMKFTPNMPKIIDLLGSVGTVQNADKISTSIFDPNGKLNTTHLVSPNFVNPGKKEESSSGTTDAGGDSEGD